MCRDAQGCVLGFHYEHPAQPYATCISAMGDGEWRVTADGLATRLTLATQRTATLALLVVPGDFREPLSADGVAEA